MEETHLTAQADLITCCTVFSRAYLSQARVLAASFLEHHPGSRFVALLCDRTDGYFDPAAEAFETIEVESLNIPGFREMAFRYKTIELCTAVKPFFFRHLLKDQSIGKLVYLDPDILVTSRMEELPDLLETHSIVLTPHATEPIDVRLPPPDEHLFLRYGTFNLGFLGMKRDAETDRLLVWWGERLARHCYDKASTGYFTDQKWMNLAPALFEGVHILKDKAYNGANWNLHERTIGGGPGGWTVNGRAMRFFHFSGFNPDKPDVLTRGRNRFTFANRPDIQPLFNHYAALQRTAGFRQADLLPNAFAVYENGELIPQSHREVYDTSAHKPSFGDPFATGDHSFYAHMKSRRTQTRIWLLQRHTWPWYQAGIRILKKIIGRSAFYRMKNSISS